MKYQRLQNVELSQINIGVSIPSLALALLLACFLCTPAFSQQIPGQMNYQGTLLDTSGDALPAKDYTIDFSIWDAVSAGAKIWGPQSLTVSVPGDGFFNVTLGPQDDNGTLLSSAFSGSSRYLEVEVCEDDGNGGLVCTALAPRHHIISTPFAFVAGKISGDAIGIGTDNPQNTLDVEGAAAIGKTYSGTETAPANGLIIEGKVGIGTVSPGTVITNSKLDVVGGHIAIANNFGVLSYNKTKNGIGAGIDTTTNDSLRLFAAGSERMRITSGGKVGIGNTNPGMSLEVSKKTLYNSPAIGGSNGDKHAYLHVSTGAHSLIWNSGSSMRFGTETGKGSGYSEKMRITSDGRVGIGNAAPFGKFQVDNTIISGSEIKFLKFGVAHLSIFGNRINGAFTFENTSSASQSGVAGVVLLKIATSGVVSAINFVETSDERFKEEVRPLTDGLSKILSLHGIQYRWKKEHQIEEGIGQTNQIGFIAQKVEKVIPEVVYTDDSGYKSLNYGKITAVLVEAIKELHTKYERDIGELSATNSRLQAEIKTLQELQPLKAKVSDLEKKLQHLEELLAVRLQNNGTKVASTTSLHREKITR